MIDDLSSALLLFGWDGVVNVLGYGPRIECRMWWVGQCLHGARRGISDTGTEIRGTLRELSGWKLRGIAILLH